MAHDTEIDEFGADDEGLGWNGKPTRVTLARPIIRDQHLVKEGEKVELRCSRDVTGEFVGPEADHLRDLIAIGAIDGTDEANERRRQVSAVEAMRGVGDIVKDEAGNPVLGRDGKPQRRFLDLREKTGAQMERNRVLRNGIFGDPKVMQAAETTENRDAMKELGQLLERALTGQGVHAGAEGPGTASNPDGTRITKKG